MSSFGHLFRVTTFGESHGIAVGVIIESCVPAGLELSVDDIQPQLDRRRPGQSVLTTQRNEKDKIMILSGVENGVTLGTPICLQVLNEDQRKFDYANTAQIPRPGHADYTYRVKYGINASSGGGRASARETIARVAAGAVAEVWLKKQYKTEIISWVLSVGHIRIPKEDSLRYEGFPPSRDQIDALGTLYLLNEAPPGDKRVCWWSPEDQWIYDGHTGERVEKMSRTEANSRIHSVVQTRCPHTATAAKMASYIHQLKEEGDSTGGILTTVVRNVPVGLGEPCFDKLEAQLAKGMLSLPATKGFEIGDGFEGTEVRGSEHNDRFGPIDDDSGILTTTSNHAGGTLGGISSGQNLVFRVAIKPVSSISIEQSTRTYEGVSTVLGVKGRHDPCVLPRAPPLTESMTALVLADAALIQRARQGSCLSVIGQLKE